MNENISIYRKVHNCRSVFLNITFLWVVNQNLFSVILRLKIRRKKKFASHTGGTFTCQSSKLQVFYVDYLARTHFPRGYVWSLKAGRWREDGNIKQNIKNRQRGHDRRLEGG